MKSKKSRWIMGLQDKMVKKFNLTFPLLRDEHNQLASQFGLTFKLPDDLAKLYSQFGLDLVRYNGNDLWTLPMPGRFILDQKGIVVSAEVNPDYTLRPEPSDIVKELEALMLSETHG